MNPKELRIGNSVYFLGVEVKVDHITLEMLCSGKGSGYEPVPLTKKRLKKLRFKKDKVWFRDGIILAQCDFGFSTWYGSFQYGKIDIIIEYVHELENLYFAIKKKEL